MTNRVRRNGSYAPLSAHYYKDDAIDEAGEAAELLYVRGLAFCADVLSDGFISERQLVRFVGVGMFDAAERAEVLVKVGLWERVDGGYVVRSWLEWNRSRDEITDAKAKDAARKRPTSPSDSVPPDSDPPPDGRSDSARNPNGVQSESARGEQGELDGVGSESSAPSSAGARARSTTDPRHSTSSTTSAKADASAKFDEEFEEFWVQYPRKEKKPKAKEKYRAARRKGYSAEHIRDGLRVHLDAWRSQNTPQNFIPLPQTWLYGEQFNDRPTRFGQTAMYAVPDLPTSFEEIRTGLAVNRAGELLGRSFVPPSQPPSDTTPPDVWHAHRAAEWIDKNEGGIRAALARKQAG